MRWHCTNVIAAAAACGVALAALVGAATLELRDNGCDATGCDDQHFLRGRQLRGTAPTDGDDACILLERMCLAASHVPKAAIWRRTLVAAIAAAILALVLTAHAPLAIRLLGSILCNFLFFYGIQNYYNYHVGRLAGEQAERAKRLLQQKTGMCVHNN